MKAKLGLAAVAVASVILWQSVANAATLEIGAGDTWAAKLSAASPGDTIQVHADAPAPVNAEITKQLTIEAYLGEAPILDGTSTAYNGFRLRTGSNGCTFSGLTFKNYTNKAITEYSATVSATLANCVFDNCYYTLGLEATASGCQFMNSNRAGYTMRASSFTNCTFTNMSAYTIYGFTNLTMTGCTIQNGAYVFGSGTSLTLTDVTVNGATNVVNGAMAVTGTNVTLMNITNIGFMTPTSVNIDVLTATNVKYLILYVVSISGN